MVKCYASERKEGSSKSESRVQVRSRTCQCLQSQQDLHCLKREAVQPGKREMPPPFVHLMETKRSSKNTHTSQSECTSSPPCRRLLQVPRHDDLTSQKELYQIDRLSLLIFWCLLCSLFLSLSLYLEECFIAIFTIFFMLPPSFLSNKLSSLCELN